MAREVSHGKRRFWILSEPATAGWRSRVVEVLSEDGQSVRELGIDAVGETRSEADDAAHGKLHQWLKGSG